METTAMLGALGRTADGTVGEIIAGWRHAYSYDGLSGVADVNMLTVSWSSILQQIPNGATYNT